MPIRAAPPAASADATAPRSSTVDLLISSAVVAVAAACSTAESPDAVTATSSSASCHTGSAAALLRTAANARLTVELCTPNRRPISTLDIPWSCQDKASASCRSVSLPGRPEARTNPADPCRRAR